MSTVPPRRLLLLVSGFILWACALLTLYGVHALGCAFDWPSAVHRGLLSSLLASYMAVLARLSARRWRRWRLQRDVGVPNATFIEYLALILTIAALVATLLTLAPSFTLSLCV